MDTLSLIHIFDATMLNFANRLPKAGGEENSPARAIETGSTANSANGLSLAVDLEKSFADIEREIIEAAINACDGSIPKASEMLQLSPSTIYRKKEGWSD